MAAPKLTVIFDFTSGATFAYPFTLGQGILGTNTLADTASLFVDITDQVQKVTINRGYNLLQEEFQTGVATVRIIDLTGDWNPTNIYSIYYPYIVPLRKVRISTDDGAEPSIYNAYLYSGYTTAYNYTWDKEQNVGYVDIELSDAFRLLNMANVSTITGATAGQFTGERVTNILDTIGFPSAMTDIDTGSTTVQADSGFVRTSLAAIKNIEFCEQGAFYAAPNGTLQFKSRQYITTTANTEPLSFSNNQSIYAGIEYKNIVTALDDKLVVNESSITRTGGTAQTAANEDSQIKYFPHSFTATDLLLQTDAQALDVARIYVGTRADTSLRVDSLVLDMIAITSSPDRQFIFDLDFFDPVSILNTGQDGTTFIKTLQIMGVRHEITPNTFNTTLTTSEPIVAAFTLNSTPFGIIGTSVLTY